MGIWLTSHRVLAGYAVLMALLVAAHYAFTGLRSETSAAIGTISAAAMVAGGAANRPARRAPCLRLAAANLATALGELGLHVANAADHLAVPLPAFGDGAYLVAYPL